MEIPTVSALLPRIAPPTDSVAADASTATADFNSFLKLLTAQLRNQDPLQPMDATQFVAQLASFATVEQMIQANAELDALSSRADAELGTRLAGWIGRAASTVDGRFRAMGGEERFRVPALEGAQSIEAVVYADDKEIDRLPVTPGPDGHAVWPGAAAFGLAPGTELRIELVYHGPETVIDRRPAPVFRTITGLRGGDDGPLLELEDGRTVPFGDIAELAAAA